MLKSKFENFLAFIKNKKILITTHDLVDIDGLVSCFTLKFFLIQYFKNQEVSIYFSELTKSTKTFIKNFSKKFPNFNFSYEREFNLSNADVLLILDTNNLNQINARYPGFISGRKLDEFFKEYDIKFAAGHWCAGDFLDRFSQSLLFFCSHTEIQGAFFIPTI